MLTKVFVYALFPFAVINAAPVSQRDLVDSAIGKATSVVGSLWHEATHGLAADFLSAEASSVYQSATSVLGTATANVHVTVTTISSTPIVEVTSVGGPAITLATLSAPAHHHHSRPVATTTFAGHTFVVPSSVSHSHSSHAPSSSGLSSSHSGSSTASSSSTSSTSTNVFPSSNGAVGMRALSTSKPMVMGAVTVFTGLLGGALIALSHA